MDGLQRARKDHVLSFDNRSTTSTNPDSQLSVDEHGLHFTIHSVRFPAEHSQAHITWNLKKYDVLTNPFCYFLCGSGLKSRRLAKFKDGIQQHHPEVEQEPRPGPRSFELDGGQKKRSSTSAMPSWGPSEFKTLAQMVTGTKHPSCAARCPIPRQKEKTCDGLNGPRNQPRPKEAKDPNVPSKKSSHFPQVLTKNQNPDLWKSWKF